mmetsp:Transcript_24092/g.51592  ORF Transcript_24092/g.51592 Transcript_24092/m.51592 type:complete len:252 (-) Transcript_24092:184-939(-)
MEAGRRRARRQLPPARPEQQQGGQHPRAQEASRGVGAPARGGAAHLAWGGRGGRQSEAGEEEAGGGGEEGRREKGRRGGRGGEGRGGEGGRRTGGQGGRPRVEAARRLREWDNARRGPAAVVRRPGIRPALGREAHLPPPLHKAGEGPRPGVRLGRVRELRRRARVPRGGRRRGADAGAVGAAEVLRLHKLSQGRRRVRRPGHVQVHVQVRPGRAGGVRPVEGGRERAEFAGEDEGGDPDDGLVQLVGGGR